jgi:hypothetical protein
MSPILELQRTSKAKHARLRGNVLRGIVLIVALYAYVGITQSLLYRGKWDEHALVFAIASWALIAIARKPETLPAIKGEEPWKQKWWRLSDWSRLSYCLIMGLGDSWVCAFLWFSRRYAFFSAPVVGATALLLSLYAVLGLFVAWLTGGNLRTSLLFFALAPCGVAAIVLRLRLLG